MTNETTTASRRNFLKTGTLFGGGLLVSFMIPAAKHLSAMGATVTTAATFAPNAFLRIGTDNSIQVLLAHSEMGQGIWTSLTMLIAEELEVDVERIQVEHAPAGKEYAHTLFQVQMTGNSSSMWSEFDRYRQAGASARTLLVQAAAQRFGVDPKDCRTENGVVIAGNKQATYGELAEAANALPPLTGPVALKKASDWKYIGKSIKRLDAPVKVNGTAIYGIDIQFPGLLTAVVAHPPVFGGKIKSVDDSKTRTVHGVRDVIKIPTGVAVLADNYWSAKKGRDALKIQWDLGAGADISTDSIIREYRQLAATKGLPAEQAGNVAEGLSMAAKVVEAEYTFPYLSHAPMEPLNCTVKITGDQCEIWTGTQMQMDEQKAAAAILGLKLEQVKVNTPFLGGGFGRRGSFDCEFVSEAVHIAKVSGKAVKMIWSREDDMKAGYYRPAYVHRMRVGLDAEGKPVAWDHSIVGQSLLGDTYVAPMMVKNGVDHTSVEGATESPYLETVPDKYVGLHTTRNGIPVLLFRSVGHTHTAAAMEGMIDELAYAAGKDPYEYRRELLKDHPRHLGVLNLAAEKAGWGKPLPEGQYRGIAVHGSFRSYVAQVVEISIEDGNINIHKVVCVVDCGLVINPDGVRSQMESCISFGITMALYGNITLEKGAVQQSNFHNYRISRMRETPEIEIHIVDSKENLGGIGEAGVPPMTPAIGNAIFAATGKRLRDLPFADQLNR